MGYGVRSMRRCVILIGGSCAAFCILWFFCTQMTAAYFSKDPVFALMSKNEICSGECLQFPFEIPGTTLVAEQIVSYDGSFSEGSGKYDVTNVAALLLRNYGQQGITDAQVVLQAGQVIFEFSVDTLPAGARILVPEKNAMEFGPETFTFCKGNQQTEDSDWQQENYIKLEYPDMGTVTLTNLSDRVLEGIYLHYKTYYPMSDFYVGGKTLIYYVKNLKPGEYIQIYPYNYALGYSKFARIEIEEVSKN